MKRIYILLLVLTIAVTGWSQTTYYWQPAVSGSWATAANWNTVAAGGGATRAVPNATDILIIDKGSSFSITNVPSQTIGRLSVLSGTITLQAGGGPAQTLTVNSGTGDDLIVASGATLVQASSLENIVLGANAAANISGTYTVSGVFNMSGATTTASISGTLDISGTGTFNLSSGTAVATVTGTGTLSNGNDITNHNATKLVFQSGAIYDHNQTDGTIPTVNYNINSTIRFSRGGTMNPFLEGTLTPGKILVTGNTNVTLSAPGGSQTLTISNGTGDDFVVNSGSSFTQNISMNIITLAANATANIAGTYAIESVEGFFLTNGGVVATVTGSLINRSVITGATAAKLIFNGGTYFHDIDGGTVPTSAWNANSTINVSGMTDVYPTGMTQSFVNVVFSSDLDNNVTMSANLTCVNLTMSITGADLRLTNDGTGRTISVSGNFNMTAASSFILVSGGGAGALNVTGNFGVTGGTLIVKEDAGTASVTIGGNYTQSGGTVSLRTANAGSTSTVSVAGSFTMSNGTIDLNAVANSSGTLNVAGNYTQSGGTISESGTGTSVGALNFNGTLEQAFSKTAGNINNSVSVTINPAAIVNFGTSVLNGTVATFTVSDGGKLITSNAAGITTGSATGSIQVGGTRTYGNGADYEFRGAVTGNFTTTLSRVRDLIINNTGAQVTMSRAFNVTRTLIMTNGYLTPGANNLTVTETGTATTANGSYVNGVMNKATNTTAAFTFPVGKLGAGLRTIGVTPTGTAATTYTAEFLRTDPRAITNGTAVGSGISRVSSCEYWTLNRTAGTADAAVTLSWGAASNCGAGDYVTELSSLRVARHTGTSWVDAGPVSGADMGSIISAGTITSGTVTSFSPFALASSNGAANPLPVLFADVKAYAKNNGIQVEWSNLTERDILHYQLERSANGFDFVVVNQQAPKSNRDDKASYTYFDATPLSGANFYRVRVQEQAGKVIYSKILRVELGNVKAGFGLYPNPVVGKQMTVSLTGIKQGQYNLRVINTAGQDVYQTTITNVGTGVTQMVELPASVKTGVYTAVISGDSYRETKIMIVQ